MHGESLEAGHEAWSATKAPILGGGFLQRVGKSEPRHTQTASTLRFVKGSQVPSFQSHYRFGKARRRPLVRRWARNPSDFSNGKIDVSHQSQLSDRAQPRNASRPNHIHNKVRTEQQKARSPFELFHRESKSRKQRSPGVEKRGGKKGKKGVRVETTKLLRSNSRYSLYSSSSLSLLSSLVGARPTGVGREVLRRYIHITSRNFKLIVFTSKT